MGGFYYQYRDTKTGKIVKANHPNAKRIKIVYDRFKLISAGKKGGKKVAAKRRKLNKRKLASKKAAATRKLKNRGGEFKGERKTPVLKYVYRDYSIDIPDREIIAAIVAREKLEGAALYYGWVKYEGEDGMEYFHQTRFKFLDFDPGKMEAEMEALTISKSAEQHGVADILEWGLSFTPPRGE